jgi:uncharacterized protein
MQYEWDEAKNVANQHKHEVNFEIALKIFEGPVFNVVDERRDYGEVRTLSVGRVDDLFILAVVHTDRAGNRRIISARRANRIERKAYEEAIEKAVERR